VFEDREAEYRLLLESQCVELTELRVLKAFGW
jgi:hypothetical protein